MAAGLTNSQNIDPLFGYDDSDKLISNDWSTHRTILNQAYNFFLACREFQCEGWKVFWCNFPFAFTYHNLPRFVKSLTVPALIRVRYLKIVVSEADSRYRSIWRFNRIVDAFLAQQAYRNRGAQFPRYIVRQLRDAFAYYHDQSYRKFFNRKIGELLGLQYYVLEVQLDLPHDDAFVSQRAKGVDERCYGYRNLVWRQSFPRLLGDILEFTGLLDSTKDFEPRIETTANGNTIFESDIRKILEEARRDKTVIESG